VLWVGTQSNGLVKREGEVWTNYTTGNSLLPEDEIRDLFVDHRNWVWITTSGGLAVFTGMEWFVYNATDESHNELILNTSSTNCVAVREDGTVCLGTINGGLHFLTDTTVFFLTIPQDGFFDNTATDVLFDPMNGERWVSTPSAGLLRQQGPPFGGVWFQWSAAIGFPTNGISAISMDTTGSVWAATQAAGVIKMGSDGSYIVLNQMNSGLPDDELRSVMATSEGELWVGTTYGGLARYSSSVGIERLDQDIPLLVFPNPASDHCIVQFGTGACSRAWSMASTDGKVVERGTSMGSSMELQLVGLDRGTYILEVVQGKLVRHCRVLVL